MLVRQREMSQKYFDILAFNWNLNNQNLWGTLGAMNFRNLELVSGSPSVCVESLQNFLEQLRKIAAR